MAEYSFNFQKLLDDSKSCLLKPKEFFTSMAKEGGYVEPIIKALAYGVVAGIIGFILTLVKLSINSMYGGAFSTLIGSIIAAIIGLFIGGIIILIISAICGGSTNFETNLRISASLMVLMPVSSLLSILSRLNIVDVLLSFIVSVYGLYMLYFALVNSLGARQSTSRIVCLVIGIIPLIVLIAGLACS